MNRCLGAVLSEARQKTREELEFWELRAGGELSPWQTGVPLTSIPELICHHLFPTHSSPEDAPCPTPTMPGLSGHGGGGQI